MSSIQNLENLLLRRISSSTTESNTNRSRSSLSSSNGLGGNTNFLQLLRLAVQLLTRFQTEQVGSTSSSSSTSSSTSSSSSSSSSTSTSTSTSNYTPPSTSSTSGSSTTSSTSTPITNGAVTPLSVNENKILSSLLGAEAGALGAGTSVTVLEGGTPNNKLSAGDTAVVRNARGEQVHSKVLSTQDVYEVKFRDNLMKAAEKADDAWGFTSSIVKLRGGRLADPEVRSYTTDNGNRGFEQVLERNDFWEVVQRDYSGRRYMVMRSTDDYGRPIKPSDAVNDIFNHREMYAFDCASPMPILNLKATLDTVGADTFNRNMKDPLVLSGWYNPYDNFNGNVNNGGYNSQVRTAPAGTIRVSGHSNLAGESARFDPNQGDRLVVGNVYYFEKPGDMESSNQGWNAVYMGQEQGMHRFWVTGVGTTSVRFNNDGSWVPAEGLFEDYYLGGVVASPNLTQSQNWNNTSVA